ncbi:hypothetical protein LXL04_019609 [Taraxacum kok-saghyz]
MEEADERGLFRLKTPSQLVDPSLTDFLRLHVKLTKSESIWDTLEIDIYRTLGVRFSAIPTQKEQAENCLPSPPFILLFQESRTLFIVVYVWSVSGLAAHTFETREEDDVTLAS